MIELVVVIAVLAVLTAVALPNFLGVSDDASARTAQQAVLNAFKECKVHWAKNKRDGIGSGKLVQREFNSPAITDWVVGSMATTKNITDARSALSAISQPKNETESGFMACFEANESERNLWVAPKDTTKFPTFGIAADGTKTCMNASKTDGTSKDTYNIGCDGSGANGSGGWE